MHECQPLSGKKREVVVESGLDEWDIKHALLLLRLHRHTRRRKIQFSEQQDCSMTAGILTISVGCSHIGACFTSGRLNVCAISSSSRNVHCTTSSCDSILGHDASVDFMGYAALTVCRNSSTPSNIPAMSATSSS